MDNALWLVAMIVSAALAIGLLQRRKVRWPVI